MQRFVFPAIVAAVIGSGLIAGTFFVFSVAVMPAFRRLPPEQAIAAMKRINDVIQNAAFLGVFLGTAIVILGLVGWALFNWASAGSSILLAGSLLYFIGSFIVTIAFNVPLNNTLARSDGPAIWKTWAASWTFWNRIRTIASILATGTLTIAASQIA